MSPLFHRADDGTEGQEPSPGHLPSLYELGPRLDEVVSNVAALPPEQFAAQLMTRYFTTGWLVASQITSMVAVDTICWDLLPDNSGEHAGESIPDAFFVLQDLVAEALQLLQTAGLVMQRSYKRTALSGRSSAGCTCHRRDPGAGYRRDGQGASSATPPSVPDARRASATGTYVPAR